jgi:hypothetical protein
MYSTGTIEPTPWGGWHGGLDRYGESANTAPARRPSSVERSKGSTMLMPAVSVTLIGLVAGLVGYLTARYRPGPAWGLGVVGAWIGFLTGALIGVSIDVVLGEGMFVAIVGHAVAGIGAIAALRRFRPSPDA